VIFKEEDDDGRERVTAEEERVSIFQQLSNSYIQHFKAYFFISFQFIINFINNKCSHAFSIGSK